MALSARLVMKQGQSLVMTPQLLQAIKLLQLSSVELNAYVENELERNPLLERDDDAPAASEPLPENNDRSAGSEEDFDAGSAADEQAGDWASEQLEVDAAEMQSNLDTDISNSFDADMPATAAIQTDVSDPALSDTAWTGSAGPGATSSGGGANGGEAPNLEAYVAEQIDLAGHLNRQLAIAISDPIDRLIGQMLIDAIDEAGYLRESVPEMAERFNVDESRVEAVLATIQGFEPAGIGARDLAECLSIQLRDRDRFDPAMQALIANLALVAKRDFAGLRKVCDVDQEDIADMLREIRELDPKPGRAFGGGQVQAVTPDVTVRPAADGSWHVELNPESLPKVLVNQTYAAQVSRSAANDADRSYISECLQDASWLTRSLEQRARTILKVASEIVRQQDAFFAEGIEHLRPLNLRIVADAIGMHESTISRVTSNKYMATHRGLFEFKYFFTAAIAAQDSGQAHSAESVRHRIKQMIDREDPRDVLSDDAIVLQLKDANIDIARRTVAKYREAMKIASSVQRRREKSAEMA